MGKEQLRSRTKARVTHEKASVARMKDPTESFGEMVSRVDHAGNEAEDNIA